MRLCVYVFGVPVQWDTDAEPASHVRYTKPHHSYIQRHAEQADYIFKLQLNNYSCLYSPQIYDHLQKNYNNTNDCQSHKKFTTPFTIIKPWYIFLIFFHSAPWKKLNLSHDQSSVFVCLLPRNLLSGPKKVLHKQPDDHNKQNTCVYPLKRSLPHSLSSWKLFKPTCAI